MAKVLRCHDLVPGGKFEARGICQEEVIAEFAQHIATVHDRFEISDRALPMITNAIHEEVRVRTRFAPPVKFSACREGLLREDTHNRFAKIVACLARQAPAQNPRNSPFGWR